MDDGEAIEGWRFGILAGPPLREQVLVRRRRFHALQDAQPRPMVARMRRGISVRFPFVFVICLVICTAIWRNESTSGLFKPIASTLCSSGIPLPICRAYTRTKPNDTHPKRADFPRLVNVESKVFNQAADDNLGSANSLALSLKNSEVATKDLIIAVEMSDIPSKDLLAEKLREFTKDAVVAGEGVGMLGVRFNAALDNIMAVNEWALETIASARPPETLSEHINALMPWSPSRGDRELKVIDTFKTAMDALEMQLERLILLTQASSNNLNKLEETLDTISQILQRNNIVMTDGKDELLSRFWTRLGFNKDKVAKFQRNLNLLKELTGAKKGAQKCILKALGVLREMRQEMEVMRERVAAPDLELPYIPIEVHMKSIQHGLDRLQESRIRRGELGRQESRKLRSK